MSIVKSLLASRKFNVALFATLAWAISLFGLDADPEQIGAVLSPLYAYVLGQGFADMGKERAELPVAKVVKR